MILQTTNKNCARNTTHGSLNKMLPFASVTDTQNTYILLYYYLCHDVFCRPLNKHNTGQIKPSKKNN